MLNFSCTCVSFPSPLSSAHINTQTDAVIDLCKDSSGVLNLLCSFLGIMFLPQFVDLKVVPHAVKSTVCELKPRLNSM